MKSLKIALVLFFLVAPALASAGPYSRPVPGQVYGLTAPNTVTLDSFKLSWEWMSQADYYQVYGKAPGSSYEKVGEADDEEITIEKTENGTWKYIVRGCGDRSGCAEFSDPLAVTFQECHDPISKNGVQAFSIVTNTNQCVNLDVTADEESYLVYSNLTPRNKFFYVQEDHNANAEDTDRFGESYAYSGQLLPLGTTFTPPESEVSLNMYINYHGKWDEERTQVMVIYDEDTRVLSLMYVNYEGEASL